MASITQRGETWIVQFLDNRKRKTVTVGTSETYAQEVKGKIETILTARRWNRELRPETIAWLEDLSGTMRERLEKAGLLEPSEPATVLTLGKFLDDYLAKRKDVKRATRITWGNVKRNLLAFFKADKPLTAITVGDAKDFERYLKTGGSRENRYADADKTEGLSPDTVRKRIQIAKQIFTDAADHKLLDENPFSKLKSAQRGNTDRQFFVTREAMTKLLAVASPEWQLLLALCRYGGLRSPSETLSLRWEDVDLANGRMIVTSPKTEHHEGKDCRTVPIFPELRPYLEDAKEVAPDGTEYVLQRWRELADRSPDLWRDCNLRTPLLRLIKRAGLKPWPKLFQNLRSTRQTELEESFPSHVVCAWMGNSRGVAQRHYLQVTDDHFSRAVDSAARCNFVGSNAAQSDANDCGQNRPNKKAAESCDVLQPTAANVEGMGGAGLEPY